MINIDIVLEAIEEVRAEGNYEMRHAIADSWRIYFTANPTEDEPSRIEHGPDKGGWQSTANTTEDECGLPYKNTVRCYWCELEAKNNGWDIEKTVLKNAVCVAKGKTFTGRYACEMHSLLLMVDGWYGELLPYKPNTEPEDEPMLHGELDGYISPDCGCKYCEYGRNQITLRKMIQYLGGHPAQKQTAYEWVCGFQDWLQQEDK